MNEIYGHQWASQQGDTPNDTWIKGCSDLDNKQLGIGLRALLGRGDAWPPSLPEFRQLCAKDYDWESKRMHKEYRPERMIEDSGRKALTDTAAKKALVEMREMLMDSAQ